LVAVVVVAVVMMMMLKTEINMPHGDIKFNYLSTYYLGIKSCCACNHHYQDCRILFIWLVESNLPCSGLNVIPFHF
jgi:hypothetical protein